MTKDMNIDEELENIYKDLGIFLKMNASGWDLWLLNGNAKLSSFLRMKCSRRFPISNGGIDCRWMHYEIHWLFPKTAFVLFDKPSNVSGKYGVFHFDKLTEW